MTTENGNRIISEFMGATFKDVSLVNYPRGNAEWEAKFPDGQKFNHYGTIEDLIGKYTKYHSSWDWLYPVYIKMFAINSELVTSQRLHWGRRFCSIRRVIADGENIKKVYEKIIIALTWYNQQGTKINR